MHLCSLVQRELSMRYPNERGVPPLLNQRALNPETWLRISIKETAMRIIPNKPKSSGCSKRARMSVCPAVNSFLPNCITKSHPLPRTARCKRVFSGLRKGLNNSKRPHDVLRLRTRCCVLCTAPNPSGVGIRAIKEEYSAFAHYLKKSIFLNVEYFEAVIL
jgi:hypothetical protein